MSETTLNLSKNTHAIQTALLNKSIEFKVFQFSESTHTAIEAAQAISCEIAQIIKSMIFKTHISQQPILVLASGANRVNEKILAEYVGEKIVKADADFTREVTGFAIGGIPPIGHLQTIKTFVDEDLLQFKEVWAAAGTPHTVFSLNSAILVELTSGTVIKIK